MKINMIPIPLRETLRDIACGKAYYFDISLRETIVTLLNKSDTLVARGAALEIKDARVIIFLGDEE